MSPVNEIAIGKLLEEVMPVGNGAKTGIGDYRSGPHPVHQSDNLGSGVVPVQRRAAHIAVARTGEERDRSLDPARQPDRDTLTRANAARCQAGCEASGGLDQLRIGQPAMTVAHGEAVWCRPCMPRRNGVERFVAPIPGSRVRSQRLRVQQGQ